jgi:hypothetical protein
MLKNILLYFYYIHRILVIPPQYHIIPCVLSNYCKTRPYNVPEPPKTAREINEKDYLNKVHEVM